MSGTNRDLHDAVSKRTFRDDLLARINLWTFQLPPLCNRPEDMEPNLEYELARWTETQGDRVTFSKEARKVFLDFATSRSAVWTGNFRDFSAAVQRMATLSEGGRITIPIVREELDRLRASWQRPGSGTADDALTRFLDEGAVSCLDLFDRVQLAEVLRVCAASKSLSDAGRTLFSESRKRRTSKNDADRVRKYLARFDLSWADIRGHEA
jgi:transcriptional regulatory protein RtcR